MAQRRPRRGLVLLILCFATFTWLSARRPARATSMVTIAFHAGGVEPYVAADGTLYQADRPWRPWNGAGYIGGVGDPIDSQRPTGGTPDDLLFRRQRHNWAGYLFTGLPAGKYVVTMDFSEAVVHGPALNVFDVAIQGQTVLDDFDLFAAEGRDYAMRRRFVTSVGSGGSLFIRAEAMLGESQLAAIAIAERAPDEVAPAAPGTPLVLGSYDGVLLDWPDSGEDDLLGYHVVRRALPGGTLERITDTPAFGSRYRDTTAVPGQMYAYRVAALDVFGNVGAASSAAAGAALTPADTGLPALELSVAPEDLALLYADPLTDDEVPGLLEFAGQTYTVEVRFRGGSQRYLSKKSWKIKFPEVSPFPGQDRINVNGDFTDWSIMRGSLGFALYEAAGLGPPAAEHVALFLNGDYMGLFQRYEQVDQGFLLRTGRDPGASIYKVNFGFSYLLDPEIVPDAFEKKTNLDLGYEDVIDFMERINLTSDLAFPETIRATMDLARYLDYYAVTVLSGNFDFADRNMYLIHDLTTDLWEVVPWDLDHAFGATREITRAVQWDYPIDIGTIGTEDYLEDYPSRLLTRLLQVPAFRAYYCERLGEYMDTLYSPTSFYPTIDDMFALVQAAGLRDWTKFGWESPDWFVTSPAEFKAFVLARSAFLQGEIPGYCPAETAFVVVNEFMASNETVFEDPDDPGEFPDWIELFNVGLAPVDLGGWTLTDDPAEPDKFVIAPGTILAPGGHLLFIADDEPEQGPYHLNFKLSAGGETVALYDGATQVDGYDFGPQETDVSEGRFPDGADAWVFFASSPTPGGPNALPAPLIQGTSWQPTVPQAGEALTVTTTITDDGVLQTVGLRYSVDDGPAIGVPLLPAGPDQYYGSIPGQPDGAILTFFLFAVDDTGLITTDPAGAPDETYRIEIGYEPPPLFMNEFAADNDSGLEDPDEPGEFPDWFEIYNAGGVALDLGGMFLTDDPGVRTKFVISPGVMIEAGGFLVFYADDDVEQGPTHVNFKLSASGEVLVLTDSDGQTEVDRYAFGPQTVDVSEGRCPDGGPIWQFFPAPTPGLSNAGGCP